MRNHKLIEFADISKSDELPRVLAFTKKYGWGRGFHITCKTLRPKNGSGTLTAKYRTLKNIPALQTITIICLALNQKSE